MRPTQASRIKPISGRQRLGFFGTLWEGKKDGWEIGREFDSLREALKPVSRYIRPEFALASNRKGLGREYGGRSDLSLCRPL